MADRARGGYVVKLPQFEGSVDLLLSLAQQGQVDLRAIPLAQIAEEYLAAAQRHLDLEEATEVLWMLAAMIEMKARLLVPKPQTPDEPLPVEEDASDLQERLEGQLAEYRSFKEVASALRALEEYQHRVFVRSEADDPNEPMLAGVTLNDLFRAFQQVLERARAEVREIPAEEVKIGDRMDAILALLGRQPAGVSFAQLFVGGACVLQVIVTFLALLELIKNRRVRAEQPKPFVDIRIVLVTG